MKILSAVAAIIFFALGATAETTNDLSDAEIQGRDLARQLLEQRPATNFIQTGILTIRGTKVNYPNISIKFEAFVYPTEWRNIGFPTNWYSVYEAFPTNGLNEELSISHYDDLPNKYYHHAGSGIGQEPEIEDQHVIFPGKIDEPFVNSDFYIGDLGLEFFHWPEQKILKRENSRGRVCKVLESTSPDPSTNGYSRVDSWIDEETLGIVQAYAYDAQGKKLKEFYPKDFKKVDGQWRVGMMEMINVQTKSRSQIEFDLKK
jgi:hypothetical protein